jgi:hypothetical protein
VFKHQLSAAIEVHGDVDEVFKGGSDGKEGQRRGNAGERYDLTAVDVDVDG